MNISKWAIKNPIPIILIFILFTLLGILSFQRLHIQNFPDINLPIVVITASLEGQSPKQLEIEVAKKLEDSLAPIADLEHIRTTISEGMVIISIEFSVGKELTIALNEVKNAIDSLMPYFPAGMETPTISIPSGVDPLVTYAIKSLDKSESELSWLIDYDINKILRATNGIGSIERLGGAEREIQINVSSSILASLKISIDDISNALNNMQVDISGGSANVAGSIQSFRIFGSVSSTKGLVNYPIFLPDGRRFKLGDIATITDTIKEPTAHVFIDSERVVGLRITRAKGYSDITVGNSIDKVIQEIEQKYPDLTFIKVDNSVEQTLESYQGSMQLLYEGALLAIIIVWIFLKDWRSTIISIVALPLSILPTFTVMYLMDFSLNAISLIAIALVIGILVDDAIVEVENISRHIKMGKTPLQASIDASAEIGLAVIATTLTIAAVFIPTVFIGGIPGLVFKQFGIIASVAVLASLLVARFLTPMMSAHFMVSTQKKEHTPAWLDKYVKLVKYAINKRWFTLSACAIFFIATLCLLPFLSMGFIPTQDFNKTAVTIELPPGTRLQETESVALSIAKVIKNLPEVTQTFTVVGTASNGSGHDIQMVNETRYATVNIQLVSKSEREPLLIFENRIRNMLNDIPGAKINVGTKGDGELLTITLAGDESEQLEITAKSLIKEMLTVKGLGAINSAVSLTQPEIQILLDLDKAAELGVSTQQISKAIRLATIGDYDSQLNKLKLDGRQLPIRITNDSFEKNSIESIKQLQIQSAFDSISLSSIATVRVGSSPTQINRLDRERNITITAELNGMALSEASQLVHQLSTLQKLPGGVFEIIDGESEQMGELFDSFGLAMLVGIFCIYCVLVLLFDDFIQPITLLSALPLSVSGVLIAMTITQIDLTMPVIIGILMLMGIVTKNSILIVEYVTMARKNNDISRLDALLDACHKRARPIVMTSIAMIFGMLPIALGVGADPSFRQPMAIAVIGGLCSSTLLSLFIVPVIFTLVDDIENKLKQFIRNFKFNNTSKP